MDDFKKEMKMGIPFCKKLKAIYFASEEWIKCNRQVADKFTLFKKIMREFYQTTSNIEVMEKTRHYDQIDFDEAFEMEKEFVKESAKPDSVKKYCNNVTWVPVPNEKPEVLEQIRKLLVA